MRHLICWLSGIILFHGSFAQDANSASFLNDGLKNIVQKREKMEENVVHAETGIFTINRNAFTDNTSRVLYQGNTYTIVIFTDKRIPDFKLLVWKSDGKGQWQRYDSVNQNNAASMPSKSFGDQETIRVTPAENSDYSFQLVSVSNANTTGRYGVVIMAEVAGTKKMTMVAPGSGGAKGNGTQSGNGANGYLSNTITRKTYFSCDHESAAWMKIDANNKWALDGEWTRTEETSLFVLNPAVTVFEYSTPKAKLSYHVESWKKEGARSTYEVKIDGGANYTLEVDVSQNIIDMIGKTTEGRWYVWRFHLKKVWVE
jgi:hypothetical protein